MTIPLRVQTLFDHPSRRFLVACYSDLMWTQVDSCIYVLNALTEAGKRGVWLSNGSNLCFSL
jgi:hypothetical protein